MKRTLRLLLSFGMACAWRSALALDCPQPADVALHIDDAALCVVFDYPVDAPRRRLLRDWIERSAHIVAAYYGRFPARSVWVHLRSMEGDAVGGGRTIDEPPLTIRIRVGSGASASTLERDWVLVHEMVHLALPEIGSTHDWLAEGLATYVEGVARAQAGNRSIADVWAEDRHSMPLGLPHGGEGGMDQTPTWGRTYWGGALFCLQADIALRQATRNQQGLQSALQAILRETGGYARMSDIDTVLRIGDSASRTRVLEDLYRRIKSTPVDTDLDALWSRLGVPADPLTEAFDDHAPLAAVRISITAPQRR